MNGINQKYFLAQDTINDLKNNRYIILITKTLQIFFIAKAILNKQSNIAHYL